MPLLKRFHAMPGYAHGGLLVAGAVLAAWAESPWYVFMALLGYLWYLVARGVRAVARRTSLVWHDSGKSLFWKCVTTLVAVFAITILAILAAIPNLIRC